MTTFIKVLAAILSSFALFWIGLGVGFWLDRVPHGWPNVAVGPFHLSLPDSLGAKLDASYANLKVCHGDVSALQAGMEVQNKAVRALQAAGDARAAAAAQAAQAAVQGRAKAAQKVKAIEATPDTAERCPVAEALIRESVK